MIRQALGTEMTPTEFEDSVLDAFAFLVNDFGFRYKSMRVHAPECWCVFHNVTTGIVVHYELGSRPWVEMAELRHHGDRVIEVRRSALEFLLQQRAPLEAGSTSRCDGDEELRRAICAQASSLRDHGGDLLRGDFAIFPRLQELAAESLRRRNATER
jgi:hypothetical protein